MKTPGGTDQISASSASLGAVSKTTSIAGCSLFAFTLVKAHKSFDCVGKSMQNIKATYLCTDVTDENFRRAPANGTGAVVSVKELLLR